MSAPLRPIDAFCEKCRWYDKTAYAYENHSASGRICEHRDPYEPDLSPFRNHPRFPFIASSGTSCRAWEPHTFDQRVDIGNSEGRLFA